MIAEPEPWMAEGLCFGMLHDVGAVERDRIFFPGRGGNVNRAKRICAACPVRTECADYAFTHQIYHGIWGGMSERERRRRRSDRLRVAS